MDHWIHAGSVEEIGDAGAKVIKGGIVVFSHEGNIFAVDNRCPHMGFPLHLGTLCDGILTCHWHHARFDVCSGGTLDPWADDVPTYPVKIENHDVWVNPRPNHRKDVQKHMERLREGLQQNLSLIIAKSVVALVEAGVAESEIAKVGVEFGTSQRSAGWGPGLTILTAMVNVLPQLDDYGRILALFHGLVHVARDCAGRAPKYMLQPLPHTDFSQARLASWYRQCIEVRDTEGAERILLAALEKGADEAMLSNMLLVAATDHFYLDGGHTFDFHNKAFEILEQVGQPLKSQVLTSLVSLLKNPTRSEELQNWQSPVNLVSPLLSAFETIQTLPNETDADATKTKLDPKGFIQQLLSDNPVQTAEIITKALRSGVSPAYLAQLVTAAAAERIARFHVQNDFSDWIAVLHTFTHAHAVHERLSHVANPWVIRGLYHAAMQIYLDRFLNIPLAPWPSAGKAQAAGYSTNLMELLDLMEGRQQVANAANWVALYLQEQGDVPALFNTLGHALLREDAEFHSFQMYEAAVREYLTWDKSTDPIASEVQSTILVALTRYLAAHAPTARELPHIARIAWRLGRGEQLFEEN